MDYDLGGSQTGFDVLRQLTILNLTSQIVITSGKDAEISSASLINEFGHFNIKSFLEKPYKDEKLQEKINELKPKKLVAKGVYGDIHIDMSKILYMYIENRRLKVCYIFENNEVKRADLEGNLSDYFALLQAPNFLCLTSYIINIAQVLEVKGKECIFKNGDELKLGTTNIAHLRAAKEHLDSL